ncbi:MAG: hypothetical protein J3Q66DRAFT_81519 [Benniella sp.]|nr:MAG: hypothetical protein J3Q66DRAFT_81519 [Benniella sp.]
MNLKERVKASERRFSPAAAVFLFLCARTIKAILGTYDTTWCQADQLSYTMRVDSTATASRMFRTKDNACLALGVLWLQSSLLSSVLTASRLYLHQNTWIGGRRYAW